MLSCRLVILMTHLSQFMNAAINLKLSHTMAILQDITDTMNGDGLYEGASTEVILEAFYNQECSDTYGLNWTDHITNLFESLELYTPEPQDYVSVRMVCRNTQLA